MTGERLVEPSSHCVPATHPALPGHFPGDPIVPGVLLVAIVIDTLREQLGPFHLSEIRHVKFLEPLRPEQVFTVEGERDAHGSIHFLCFRGERCVAEGNIIVA